MEIVKRKKAVFGWWIPVTLLIVAIAISLIFWSVSTHPAPEIQYIDPPMGNQYPSTGIII